MRCKLTQLKEIIEQGQVEDVTARPRAWYKREQCQVLTWLVFRIPPALSFFGPVSKQNAIPP